MEHAEELLEILTKARADWYFIGKGLDCKDEDLDAIETKYLNSQDSNLKSLRKMLNDKIKKGGLTRSKLCKSLRGRFVNRDDVAQEIEALHLKD